MFSASADCAKTWSPPRVLSRVQSGDVNDDGVTTAADVARVQASYTRVCGQTGFNPNADTNNDCKVDLLDLAFVGKMVGQPVPTQPRLSQGAALAIDPVSGALQIAWRRFNDGVLPDAIVTVRSTNGGTSFSSPTVVAPLGPFEQRTTTTTFRTNAFPTLAIDGTGRAYLAWSARGYAPQNPDPAAGDGRVVIVDVDQRDHLVGADAGGQSGEPRPSDHAGARVRAGQAATRLLRPARGSIAALRAVRRRAADSRWHARACGSGTRSMSGPPRPIRGRRRRSRRSASRSTARGASRARRRFSSSNSTPRTSRSSGPAARRSWATTSTSRRKSRSCGTVRPGASTRRRRPVRCSTASGRTIATSARRSTGCWTDYTPPNPPFARPAMSAFDPAQAIPACVPGQAGMRNQNIYTARITPRPGRRRARQLPPARRHPAQLPGLRPEQQHDDPDLPADDHQSAGGRAGVVPAVRAAHDSRRPRPAQVHRRPHGVRALERSPRANQRQRRRDRGPGRRARAQRAAGHDRPQSRSDDAGSGESGPRKPRPREPGPRECRGPQSGPGERDRPQSGPRESRPRKPRPGEPGPREHDRRQHVDSQPRSGEPGPREPGPREPRSRESGPRERRPDEWRAQRHDVDGHEQGQHGGRATPSGSRSIASSRPASRASSSRTRSTRPRPRWAVRS